MIRPADVLKAIELAIRRALILLLSRLVRRSSPPPTPGDLTDAKILLIRQDRIGDVLVSTPFMYALSESFPGIRMDILVSRNNAVATEGIPILSKRWVYTKRPGEIISLIRSLRHEQYDIAIDLMDNPSATSTLFCLLSGARWTFGLEKENAFVYDVRVPLRSRKDVHIVHRICELLRPFGIDPVGRPLRIRYAPDTAANAYAQMFLDTHDLRDRTLVGVNISAGSDARYWGRDNFTELVKRTRAAFPSWRIVLLSKPGDEQRARSIAEEVKGVVVAKPSSRFSDFAALIGSMTLLVTPDTAAVHLASAFSIPSVVLFVQTDPSLRIWDPFETPHVALISSSDTLSTISVDDVFAALSGLSRVVLPRGKDKRRPVKKWGGGR